MLLAIQAILASESLHDIKQGRPPSTVKISTQTSLKHI